MLFSASTKRKVSAAWTDLVSTFLIPDPTTGENVEVQHFAQTGHPALPIPLVVQADAQADGDVYPKSGTATAGAATTISFPAGITADPTGLYVLCTNDSPSGVKGQVRRIVSVTGSAGSWVGTVNLAWGTNPSNATTFQLLIPLFRAQQLLIKGEFQNSGTLSATILAQFYAVALTPALVATATPIQVPDQELALDSLNRQGGTVETSYYHARPRTIPALGMLGAKIILVTKPSAGKLGLWACGI